MEIARVIPSFYPNVTGPANQAYRISLELERAGIHSPIYTSNYKAEKSPIYEIIDGITVRRFPVRGKFLSHKFTPGMVRELTKTHPEIIHAHGSRSFQSDVSYLISKMKHIPLVLSTHGSVLGYERLIRKRHLKMPYLLKNVFLLKCILTYANYVIASTKQESNELMRFGVEKEKLEIIPVGIDVKEYDMVKSTKNKGFLRLLFVGRITKNRNLELLLDAFDLVAKERKNSKLTIVGGEQRSNFLGRLGYLDTMKRKVEALGLSGNVEFTGSLHSTDLIKAYKSADIFVYTSLYESFGQTILEAAASSLPIISTPVGVAKDLIVDGKSGFLTPFDDPVGLSKKVLRLLCNEGLRRKFSRNIKAVVREEYSWDRIIDKYLGIYDRLASCD